MKVWTICNSTCSYTCIMQVYTGKDSGSVRETNQHISVVLDLVKDIKKSGQNITCDNFLQIDRLHKNFFKKSFTGRNNKKEQAETPYGIYST